MKTKSRNILSVLLAVIMVLSIVPMAGVSSFAVTSGDFEYEVLSETDKTCKITGYTGSATNLTILSTIDGYKVTSISGSAFWDCTSLTSVTIPDSVESIWRGAFYNCTSLTEIIVSADNSAYSSKDGVLFDKEQTRLIAYPAGKTDSSYIIPNGVMYIDDLAFDSCTSLTSVTIPDSVTSISCYYAPPAGYGPSFRNCTSLTEINVSADNTAYSSKDGVLFNKDQTELITYPAGKTDSSYTIPNSVTTIDYIAFKHCTSLKSITIPDSVTHIGCYAFDGCTSLTSLTIGNGVTSFVDGTFRDCTSLTSVTIPDSVTSLEGSFFGYDNDYKKIDNFTIYGNKGSAAEDYAKNNGFKFVPLNDVADVSMYRLYNPNSGEHFYTADINEKNNLVSLGWNDEGIGWTAPETSSAPVYRLYNKEGGEHHYTTDINEKNYLVSLGWNDEGIGWYSDDAKGVPLYRQYNPNAFANNHNYTTDKGENDWLVGLGWRAEGIGWYGVA